ncbi:MAG TPA: hypothetical protein VFN88_03470, partial [Caulobacteraceae bacterium]|nr:hypothetical protein [Caulobacteraceae bacterium]
MNRFHGAFLAFLLASGPALAAAPYPKGVAQAGLQSVFDARPGPVRGFKSDFRAGPPKGFSGIVAGTFGWRGGGALKDFDASGYELYFNGGAFTLDNLRFSATKGLYTFAVGHVNGGGGPARLTLTNSVVDQANPRSDRGSISIGRGSTFSASRVSFLHASNTNLNIDGDSTLTDVYFDSPGQNPTGDAHTEGPHYYSGTHTVTRGFFDARGFAGHNTHATGLLYVEAANGDVDVTIKDSILAGARGIGIYSPIQVMAKQGLHAALHMENVVLQAGDYAGGNAAMRYVISGPNGVTITCHNCRDYDTGQVIDTL